MSSWRLFPANSDEFDGGTGGLDGVDAGIESILVLGGQTRCSNRRPDCRFIASKKDAEAARQHEERVQTSLHSLLSFHKN